MSSVVSRASRSLFVAASLAACSSPAPAPAPAPAQTPAAAPAPMPTPMQPATPAQPFASQCNDVHLMIALRPTAEVLEVEATLLNDGKTPVSLVRTGDGSSSGQRNPGLTFALTPDTKKDPDRCGMMNAFEDADFVDLAPGAKTSLSWIYPPRPSAKGRYTLRVTYRNDPARVDTGAKLTDAQRARHLGTMACEVTSNALTFDWDGTKARPAK